MRSFQLGVLLFLVSQLVACGDQVVGWPVVDGTAPTVSSTTPAAGATGVAFNAPVTATFSEEMDPATITAGAFTVLDGTVPVPGIVTYAGATALFAPEANLVPDTKYTVTITSKVADLAGNELADDYEWSFTTGTAPDTKRPKVSSTVPVNRATDVAFNSPITVTFSEAMDPATVTVDTFSVGHGKTLVSGTVSYVGVTATFNPTDSLSPSSVYVATVTSGVKDLAGNAMADDYEWSFTTGIAPDTTPPEVSSITPASDAAAVALNAPVAATFSEAMAPLTISTATFTLTDGVVPVPGTVMYVGVTAIFVPTSILEPGTLYTATITPEVTDLAGNAMAQEYVWSFTTGETVDLIPPQVSATFPASGATAVVSNAPITATFTKAMAPLTISTATFTILDGLVPVPGTVMYVGVTAFFTPEIVLDSNTVYEATIALEVTDLAGNAMAQDYVWSFTTGMAPDTTPPMVSSTNPSNGAADVAFNAPISATFSEAMAPLTISTVNFTLLDGLIPVPGTVIYVGVTATFNPTDDLAPDTLYTGTIKAGVTDLAGNAMAQDHVWIFTTGSAPDTALPMVSFTTPADGATAVAFNGPVSATFSEAMDPLTITPATFTLLDGLIPVPGTVIYVGVTALFTPTKSLAPDTLYTATIKAGVTDLAGNAMVQDYVWSFTTGSSPDNTPPMVSSTTPANGAPAVAFNGPVSATFTEVMDPLTITPATFTLLDGLIPVPGTVIYVGVTALFTPTKSLDPDTLYTATIKAGVKDLAGNPMAGSYIWTFTTGLAPDITPPMVSSTTPGNGATAVVFNAPITATFTEAMAPLTITPATFTLLDGLIPVPGTVIYVGVTALFTPTMSLKPNTLYTATIKPGVKDLAGNLMIAKYVWTFTTGETVDNIPPQVSSTNPVNGATEVVLNAPIVATFNEAMAPLTISTATFTLLDGLIPVPGTVMYVGVTATFDPTDSLAPDTLYKAKITTGVKDLAGNPLAAEYTWTFTTGPVPDTQEPSVTFTVPADDASNVALGSDIVAVFSEAMDPLTITAANFTVQQLDTPVAGTVDYVGVTATFHPTFALDADTVYSGAITTVACDLAGNALADNYVWNFKTGATQDNTSPMVVSTVPEDGAISVLLDSDVSATFNETMDPLTLNTATFTLMDGLVPVAGAVSLIGSTVVFDPTNDLDPNTEYTATITDLATDLAGNALAEDYEWVFTTGSILDLGMPTVILTNPEDQAMDVPVNTTVNASFSEDMDPLSISTATFLLTGPGGSEVIGTVVYDPLTLIGTFTPENELLPATIYFATITVEAMDLAGNTLEMDYEWSFSTGETQMSGLMPVDLGSLSTFVAVAGAGLTNSNSSGITVLNGDVGLSPTGTCMGDGSPCSLINPVINGTLYVNDPEGIAAKAKVDLVAAYVDATSRPVGTTVNDISGMVLAPGVYTSGSTMSVAVGGTVTLDGQGNANAVWIFQIGSSLTVNNNAQVLLINGAKAKNVFWAAFASSTLGGNVSFQGSVLAGASNSVGTDSTVVGRLLCTTGQITLLSNTITLPPL